jgi:hypothetical protein
MLVHLLAPKSTKVQSLTLQKGVEFLLDVNDVGFVEEKHNIKILLIQYPPCWPWSTFQPTYFEMLTLFLMLLLVHLFGLPISFVSSSTSLQILICIMLIYKCIKFCHIL